MMLVSSWIEANQSTSVSHLVQRKLGCRRENAPISIPRCQTRYPSPHRYGPTPSALRRCWMTKKSTRVSGHFIFFAIQKDDTLIVGPVLIQVRYSELPPHSVLRQILRLNLPPQIWFVCEETYRAVVQASFQLCEGGFDGGGGRGARKSTGRSGNGPSETRNSTAKVGYCSNRVFGVTQEIRSLPTKLVLMRRETRL